MEKPTNIYFIILVLYHKKNNYVVIIIINGVDVKLALYNYKTICFSFHVELLHGCHQEVILMALCVV